LRCKATEGSANPCFGIKTSFLLAKENISKAMVRRTFPYFVRKIFSNKDKLVAKFFYKLIFIQILAASK